MKKLHQLVLTLFITLLAASCSKMDEYLDFTGRKEISYTGKVDSLKARSGDGRLELTWLLIADPKISGVSIYFNNKKDSVILPVKRSAGIDSMYHIFPNLEEGTYSFEIYTWNAAGSRSVPAYITGRSYGTVYKGGLLNRPITEASLQDNGDGLITWGLVEETVTGMEVTYTNTSGQQKKLQLPRTENTTTLENYQPGSEFSYRTSFRPDTLSIDTFYASPITGTMK